MPEVQIIKNHTEETLTEDEKLNRIEELRQMIEDCSIINLRTDDVFLTRYLMCCDWNAMDAFNRMKKLFKLKWDHPKWFANRKLGDYGDILKHNAKFMLSNRDKKGRRIYLSKMGNVASSLSLYDLAQLDDLWFEAMLNENDTIKNGIVVLIDMNGYSWKMLKWLAPGNVKVASQKADLLPMKQMEVHIVNSSILMNTAVSIIFPILSQSIKDQVHFHYQNWPSLHEHLGKDCLPAEYGGSSENIDHPALTNYLTKHEDFLNQTLSYGYISNPIESNGKMDKKAKHNSKSKSVAIINQ